VAELLPPEVLPPWLPTLREALHLPAPPDARRAAGHAGRPQPPGLAALKFEELLAQQLSQLQAQRERAHLRAPALQPRAGGLHERCWPRCPLR
jgi:ATP-dependent DNA helicase RecG